MGSHMLVVMEDSSTTALVAALMMQRQGHPLHMAQALLSNLPRLTVPALDIGLEVQVNCKSDVCCPFHLNSARTASLFVRTEAWLSCSYVLHENKAKNSASQHFPQKPSYMSLPSSSRNTKCGLIGLFP